MPGMGGMGGMPGMGGMGGAGGMDFVSVVSPLVSILSITLSLLLDCRDISIGIERSIGTGEQRYNYTVLTNA